MYFRSDINSERFFYYFITIENACLVIISIYVFIFVLAGEKI